MAAADAAHVGSGGDAARARIPASPFLLTDHVVSTRVADTWFHADFGYFVSVLAQYRVLSPSRGLNQLIVLLVAWTHAMIGLRYNLALRPWYPRWQPYLFAAALLLPTFSILGVFEGGSQVVAMTQDPAALARLLAEHPHARPPEDVAYVLALTAWLRLGFLAALIGGVLAARIARWSWRRREGIVRITYPSGRVVEIVPGLSVLEASRLAGIPHASVCGGRGQLLYLPHPRRGRPLQAAAAVGRREPRAAAGRGRARACGSPASSARSCRSR